MSRLRVLPIVEGHGEEQAIRILLRRIWSELLSGEFIDVLHPIRRPRTKLVQEVELCRAVDLAALKIRYAADQGRGDTPALILVLLDADDDLPCELGPKLLECASRHRSDIDIACVLANREYETWFAAGAESLLHYFKTDTLDVPSDPEKQRCRKAWIEERFAGSYSETIDQPGMTSALDLNLCRHRSPSFDKLCRELEKRRRFEEIDETG